jgi:ParB family chromosome partitioning protein
MKRQLAMVQTRQIDDKEYRLRSDIDESRLLDLKESIRRDGVLVPILLRSEGESYLVVAGHRRFAAAVSVGLQEIPAYIVECEDRSGWTGAFAENLFRQDLSVIEEAAAIKDLLESNKFSHEQLARALGKSEHWIADRLDIATWPDEITAAIHYGFLSVAAARNLTRIDDEAHRKMLADYAIQNGATARTTAAWLQAWEAGLKERIPEDISPVPAREGLPPIEPHTPCTICGKMQKMADLRYPPICPGCIETVMELSRRLRDEFRRGPDNQT